MSRRALAASSLVALLALPASTFAQSISAEFSPNPAPPGVTVTLTATDVKGAGLQLSSPCTWYSIHPGTPAGPPLALGGGCGQIIVPVPPHGSFIKVWDQTDSTGATVPPGTYWFRMWAYDNGFTTTFTDWACLSIQPAGAPTLSALTGAQVGAGLDMAISSPAHPGAPYFAAASYGSNNPLPLPGGGLSCLDNDELFVISLAPPPSVFSNFSGALDGSGAAGGISIAVPTSPAFAYHSLKVQALLLGPGGPVATNGLSFTIQP